MRRREFIVIVAGATSLGWPSSLRGQQRMPVIGFLSSASPEPFARFIEAFRRGLEEAGYVEGKSIAIEFRWAEGDYDRLPNLAAELVRNDVQVIVTHGTPGGWAAKQASTTTPVVTAISGDPIATGLVRNLARPEGNVTGSTFFIGELNAKRLELLKEALPQIARVAALSNPNNPVSRAIIPMLQGTAAQLGLELEVADSEGPTAFGRAFETAVERRVDAVIVTQDGEFAPSFKAIAALASANKLPSIGSKEYGEAGGLIGYGADLVHLYRRAAYFVDRILKGAKPPNLPPVERPTKFELIINSKVARALGFQISPTLLARADEVIE